MSGLTKEGCAARRSQLADTMDANLVIIANPRHIYYLTNFYRHPFGLSHWGGAFLLIDPYHQQSALIVNNWAEAAAKAAFVDEVLVWNYYDSISPAADPFSDLLDEVNLRLPIGGRKIAGEYGWLPWGLGLDNLIDISPKLMAMRRRKYPDELELIQKAVRLTEIGHQAAREVIHPGISELDVYNHIQATVNLAAEQPIQLMGDFASGERAFHGGGLPTTRILQEGDLMILDMFPVINGYKGDFTATAAVSTELTKMQTHLESALHAALAAGEALLKPQAHTSDIYHAMHTALVDYDPVFAAGFTHHAGHGIGLGHPEAPFLVPQSYEVLEAGNIITLEPGSYNAELGFGARIEHNYMITETGFIRLSHHSTSFL